MSPLGPLPLTWDVRNRVQARTQECGRLCRHCVAPGLLATSGSRRTAEGIGSYGRRRGRIVDDDPVSLVERTTRTARSCAFSAFWHRIRFYALFRPTPNSPKAGRPGLIVPIVSAGILFAENQMLMVHGYRLETVF